MKTAKTFRLSAQAVQNLRMLAEETGANETAIIEIALALFGQDIRHSHAGMSDGMATVALDLGGERRIDPTIQPKKKRRRH
jgi:predicted transcriptional regulator